MEIIKLKEIDYPDMVLGTSNKDHDKYVRYMGILYSSDVILIKNLKVKYLNHIVSGKNDFWHTYILEILDDNENFESKYINYTRDSHYHNYFKNELDKDKFDTEYSIHEILLHYNKVSKFYDINYVKYV